MPQYILKAQDIKIISNNTSSSSSAVSNCSPPAKLGFEAPKYALRLTSLVGKTAFELQQILRRKRGLK